MEDALVECIENFDFINYFPNQLSFFVDFSLLQAYPSDKNVLASAFSSIFNCISSFLLIDKNHVLDKKMLDGTVMDNFLTDNALNNFVFMSGIRPKIQSKAISREELRLVLCENINFLY